MEEESLFKKLFESFASRTAIAILGIIGTLISIYAFFEDKKIDLKYEIIANTNVLDFNAEISKLEVIYDSTNLKKSNENLRIFTVKIIINGDQDILKEFYDSNEPLAIKISSGKIIENPELIQASSAYLKRNVKFVNHNSNVAFSQVILESGEFFVIKLLVLHKKDKIPTIISLGKIAGQKQIEVVNSINDKENDSFFGKSFKGNIWVQLVRLVSYFFIVVLTIITIGIIFSEIDDRKEKRRRKRLVKNFKNLDGYKYSKRDDIIFERYLNDFPISLKSKQFFLSSETELNESYNRLKNTKKTSRYKRLNTKIYDTRGDNWSIIKEMIEDGIIFIDGDKITINKSMKETLDKFVNFLKEHGEFKNDKQKVIHKFVEND